MNKITTTKLTAKELYDMFEHRRLTEPSLRTLVPSTEKFLPFFNMATRSLQNLNNGGLKCLIDTYLITVSEGKKSYNLPLDFNRISDNVFYGNQKLEFTQVTGGDLRVMKKNSYSISGRTITISDLVNMCDLCNVASHLVIYYYRIIPEIYCEEDTLELPMGMLKELLDYLFDTALAKATNDPNPVIFSKEVLLKRDSPTEVVANYSQSFRPYQRVKRN